MTHVRAANPLFLSIGIHLTLAALMIGALSVVQKTLLTPPEKIKLKILLNSPEPSTMPIPPISQPIPKQIVSEPSMQPKALPTPTPIKTPPLEPIKPMITPPQPALQVTSPITPKVVETPTLTVSKAPPPPPKMEENYAEENLGKIRTILMARLTYPKNALRLKQQGEATVTFTLETNREVNQITITQSSGFEMLDNAAKELIESSANEFPKPKKSVRISVPIVYKLR